MKIRNKQFGEIEFTADHVLTFQEGLLGFEDLTKYLLIKTDNELFFWLNSIEQPEIAFPLIGLRIIDEDYPQFENEEALGIVTLKPNPADVTVNLKAPLYLDQEKKIGYQTIIDTENYDVNYKLFTE